MRRPYTWSCDKLIRNANTTSYFKYIQGLLISSDTFYCCKWGWVFCFDVPTEHALKTEINANGGSNYSYLLRMIFAGEVKAATLGLALGIPLLLLIGVIVVVVAVKAFRNRASNFKKRWICLIVNVLHVYYIHFCYVSAPLIAAMKDQQYLLDLHSPFCFFFIKRIGFLHTQPIVVNPSKYCAMGPSGMDKIFLNFERRRLQSFFRVISL